MRQLSKITAIVADVLEVPTHMVDPADDLEVEFGVDSFERTDILSLLREEFRTQLNVDIGMRCKSVRDLDYLVTNALY